METIDLVHRAIELLEHSDPTYEAWKHSITDRNKEIFIELRSYL